jgi:hypothetical protein
MDLLEEYFLNLLMHYIHLHLLHLILLLNLLQLEEDFVLHLLHHLLL